MAKNHKLIANSLRFDSQTRSRNRARIVTAATRHLKLKPGSRVNVIFTGGIPTEVVPCPTGRYKIEKDGGIRFPAHTFGVPQLYSADSNRIHGAVAVTPR